MKINIKKLIRQPSSEICIPYTLYFSPIKKPRLKFMFEKVTELGVADMVPVITQNTNAVYEDRRDSLERFIVESVEQSERLTVPRLHRTISLASLLNTWNVGVGTGTGSPDQLLVCRERSPDCPSLLSLLLGTKTDVRTAGPPMGMRDS